MGMSRGPETLGIHASVFPKNNIVLFLSAVGNIHFPKIHHISCVIVTEIVHGPPERGVEIPEKTQGPGGGGLPLTGENDTMIFMKVCSIANKEA